MPKLLLKTREDIHAGLNSDVRKLFESATKEMHFSAIDEATIAARLNELYRKAFDVDIEAWQERAGTYLEVLRSLQSEYGMLRGEQIRRMELLRAALLRYFEGSQNNLAMLGDVAGEIKSSAIEPSFKLLDTTKAQLEAVRRDVEQISFD